MPYSLRYPDLHLHLHLTPFEKQAHHLEEIQAPADKIDILYVYGLGIPAKALLNWLAENTARQLIFLEEELSAFEGFPKNVIDHPQIHLRWVFSSKDWDDILEACAAQFSRDKIEVVAIKAYEKRPRYRKIKLSLLRKSVLWHAVTSENISGHLLHKNIVPNLRRLPQCSYVNEWKGAWKGTPVIICGAGPSLQAAADDLRKVRDQALIIGCGSALSALAHLGIRPHLGMAIDPNSREYDCLKGCTYRDLPLLFGSRLYPRVFELFNGPLGYIRSGTGSLVESYTEEELGMKDPFLGYDLGREALSVTTLALSLAQAWGCNPIILAGVDLAYSRKKHYSDGVPVSATFDLEEKSAGEQVVRRKGAQGRLVPTLIKWIMERDTIDVYAKNHPKTVFLNSSSGGLGFKHIPYRAISKIHLEASTDYDEKVRRLVTKTKIPASMEQVDTILASLRSSLGRCREMFHLLQQEEPSSGKAALYQIELETELAYQLILRSSKKALERVGARPPSSDPKWEEQQWKFLEEAARSYLEFF